MKYQNNKKHPVVFLIAALLACQPITAQAVTFADINQVPWPGAEVSINKAADLGLVVGETRNGKSYFKPKDPVSLAESCQFAYKVMVQTGKATADASVTQKWASVMNVYKIQSWAHTAVAYCLENNIVSISDLSGFVSGETNRSATREQAAEILGRALEVGVPSLRATATATTFVDNASISADARPYIALLNSQKIVNGDDLNKFNPKNTLNRTETAVMVTNLYEKLKSSPTVVTPVLTSKEGKIADITNFYVNLDGSASYYLYSSSGISATLNEKTSTISELINLFKSGSTIEVKLTFDSNHRVTKIEAAS
ncbi:MAG: S-layer homology domain-containing protein, partial [Anaerotignum sp.]|nr:S-layer homology domain-containing protein [Anaerotignum sp.]